MSNCGNCSQSVNNPSSTAVRCDGCRSYIHLACIGLTNDESQRITRNRSRCIKFFCNSCNSTDLKALLTALTTRIEALENTIKSSMETTAPKSLEPKLTEEIVAEAKERIIRSKNVIVRGLKEQNGSASERKEADIAAVNNIIRLANEGGPSVTPLSVIRLGRVERARGPRPIKVAFSSEREAYRILKGKSHIVGKDGLDGVRLQDDKTPQEVRYLDGLRGELERRKEAGEVNLTIKYQNHVPTIVEKSPCPKK